jgi:hypothetical protein
MSYQISTTYPSKLVFLNSANARYIPEESLYIWSFTETLQCPANHSFLISVRDAQIPFSYYQINANNNRYYVNGVLFTIPQGNYNVIELINQLKFNHPTFTFNYKETTNKLTIASSTPFRIENDTSYEPFLRVLGFRKDIYEGQSSYTSDSVVNLSGYNNLFIYSNLTHMNLDSTANRGSNVMAKVPVSALPNGIIFYEMPAAGIKQVITHHSISEVKLQLLDTLYFPLHLNYVDWSVTIQVEIVRVTDEGENPLAVTPLPNKRVSVIPTKKSRSRV